MNNELAMNNERTLAIERRTAARPANAKQAKATFEL